MTDLTNKLSKFRKELKKLIQAKEYSNALNKIDHLLDALSEHENGNPKRKQKINDFNNQDLAESEEKFRALFRSSRDAIVLVKEEGFVDCNQATLNMFGYESKDEFLKLHPADISPENQPNGKNSFELSNQYIRKAYKKKVPIFEWIHKKKDGKEFPCEVLLSTINLGSQLAVHALIRDISERKKAIIEIKRNEEKFRKLAELSPSAISIQRKNVYFFVNSAWSEITGYDMKEIARLGPYDIIHPDMIDYVKDISNKKLKREGDKYRYNLKIITKTKEIKWLDVSITTIKYEKVSATFAISNDITELRNMQHSIKESEEKYRSLIENLRHEYFFYRHDHNGAFEYVSPSIKGILGYDPDIFLKRYDKYLTDSPLNNIAKQKTQLALQGIQQLPYELEIYDIQKNKHILEISEAPIVDALGNVKYVEGIAHDITSKKKAEKIINDQLEEIKINNEEIKSINEELHAVNDDLEARFKEIDILNKELSFSKTKYETLVKNIPGIVFRCRIDKEWTMEYISDEVELLTGYKASDFIMNNTRSYTSIIHQDDRSKLEKTITNSLTNEKSYSEEYRLVHKNGDIIWVYERGQQFFKGKKTLINGVVLDITDKKKVEEKLIKSEKELRRLNAQKDKFFSLVAHDLRSPIGNFLQISELLKLKYKEFTADQADDFLDNMHSLADRTFKLLENLLLWSKSQLGHLEVKPERIVLRKVLAEVVYLLEENLKAKNIQFENNIPDELEVLADINVVQTLFRNLITNAIKFSYDNGIIKVELNDYKDEYEESVVISVKDTGVGIPADKIDKILSIDEDYSTLGTKREKGTGLGLILCKELIDKSGEKMWVESKEGKGTSFSFTLKR